MSKRSVIQRNDGYLMLLDAVYFNGKRIGNISEEGLDWSGEDAQTVELWAAQIRTNPVLDIETRAATNEITGKMIEMVPQNYQKLEKEEDIANMEKMLDLFDDDDDVQNVWHNWEQE